MRELLARGRIGRPALRGPPGLVRPRLATREQALGEADARLDEDALGLRCDLRPEIEAAVPVAGLVAAVGILVGRGEVRHEPVRVPAVERRPAGRALLHGKTDLGEDLARPGDD